MLHVADEHVLLDELGQTVDMELAHGGELIGHPSSLGAVALTDDIVDERLPCIDALEVAAPAYEQGLLERSLEDTIARLGVAVLLLLADFGGARRHPEVPHHRDVVLVERPLSAFDDHALAVGDPMRGGCGVVGLVIRGDPAELEERALHALPERGD